MQRAFKRENELENWIQKYDHEMGEKQDELEQLEDEYTGEKTELCELEEKLEVNRNRDQSYTLVFNFVMSCHRS